MKGIRGLQWMTDIPGEKKTWSHIIKKKPSRGPLSLLVYQSLGCPFNPAQVVIGCLVCLDPILSFPVVPSSNAWNSYLLPNRVFNFHLSLRTRPRCTQRQNMKVVCFPHHIFPRYFPIPGRNFGYNKWPDKSCVAQLTNKLSKTHPPRAQGRIAIFLSKAFTWMGKMGFPSRHSVFQNQTIYHSKTHHGQNQLPCKAVSLFCLDPELRYVLILPCREHSHVIAFLIM